MVMMHKLVSVLKHNFEQKNKVIELFKRRKNKKEKEKVIVVIVWAKKQGFSSTKVFGIKRLKGQVM